MQKGPHKNMWKSKKEVDESRIADPHRKIIKPHFHEKENHNNSLMLVKPVNNTEMYGKPESHLYLLFFIPTSPTQ